MNQKKIDKRKAAGDADPTQVSMTNTTMPGAPPANNNALGYMGAPAQPNPNDPQGAGNLMNNPQVAQSMGGGIPQPGSLSGNAQSPYGDDVFAPDVMEKTGTVGFVPPSGMRQQDVMGRKLNSQAYNSQQQPGADSQGMMLSYGMAQSAQDRAAKNYGQLEQPPYQAGPMGMMPMGSIDEAMSAPAAIPFQITEQSGDHLLLQGTTDASAQPKGMNMGMGARNQTKA